MEAPPGERIDWHTAFCGALRLSFEGYEDTFRFVFEHRLTAEPGQTHEKICLRILRIKNRLAEFCGIFNLHALF